MESEISFAAIPTAVVTNTANKSTRGRPGGHNLKSQAESRTHAK